MHHQAIVGDDVFAGAWVINVGYEADDGNDEVLAGSEAVDKGHNAIDEGCDTIVEVCEAIDMDRGAVDEGLTPLMEILSLQLLGLSM